MFTACGKTCIDIKQCALKLLVIPTGWQNTCLWSFYSVKCYYSVAGDTLVSKEQEKVVGESHRLLHGELFCLGHVLSIVSECDSLEGRCGGALWEPDTSVGREELGGVAHHYSCSTGIYWCSLQLFQAARGWLHSSPFTLQLLLGAGGLSVHWADFDIFLMCLFYEFLNMNAGIAFIGKCRLFSVVKHHHLGNTTLLSLQWQGKGTVSV